MIVMWLIICVEKDTKDTNDTLLSHYFSVYFLYLFVLNDKIFKLKRGDDTSPLYIDNCLENYLQVYFFTRIEVQYFGSEQKIVLRLYLFRFTC